MKEELSEPRQIELLRAVFEAIVLDESGMIGFTLRAPFDSIFKRIEASSNPNDGEAAKQIGEDLIEHVAARPARPIAPAA